MKKKKIRMNRKKNCHACNAIKNGIKSRVAFKHTCGLERAMLKDFETEKDQQ